MNSKLLTTFILSIILLTTFVAAEVYESNYVFDGDTEQELVGVSVIMYVCQDEACDTATRLWANTMNTGNDNLIVLTYPTVLVSEFGYMTYFFKPGYVPTKVPADWAGKGNAGEYDNYLYKIQDNAHAPIEDFKVSDKTIKANEEITISANILSPRINSDNVKFIPEELVDNYYSDKVKVTLQINGETIDSKILSMFWSTEDETEFTWTPLEEGKYTIQIITEITDNKFLNTEIEKTQIITIDVKGEKVDPEDPDDDKKSSNIGHRSVNLGDNTEEEQYLNQFNRIAPDNEEQSQDIELSNWQRFIGWFNNLFYKVFWFLD